MKRHRVVMAMPAACRFFLMLLLPCLVCSAVPAAPEEEKKIEDNSFLVEEAYNQEPRVVQHIQSFQYTRGGDWLYTFTQEWPVTGRTHQLSYTISAAHPGGPGSGAGLGDIAINYRYQAVFRERVACAPRFSVLLPSGDYKRGFGTGGVGLQAAVPLSVELSSRWVAHLNAGLTGTPRAKAPDESVTGTVSASAGGSLICLLAPIANLMLEGVWYSNQTAADGGRRERDDTFILNPGARFAINFRSGLQIVPGISVPIDLSHAEHDTGVFIYLSFEHPY